MSSLLVLVRATAAEVLRSGSSRNGWTRWQNRNRTPVGHRNVRGPQTTIYLNAAGRLLQTHRVGDTQTGNAVTENFYDLAGRLDFQTVPDTMTGSITRDISYDALGRVSVDQYFIDANAPGTVGFGTQQNPEREISRMTYSV